MSKYAIIVQNDESQWQDVKGDLYHYPNMYKNILTPGCKIIYYKGVLKNKKHKPLRLSAKPHYFGIGVMGDSILDPDSTKQDRFCEILDYQEFEEAVPIKVDDKYLEDIPTSKQSNYWRYGVREISGQTYDKILGLSMIKDYVLSLPDLKGDFESHSLIEGNKKGRYSTYYERLPINRAKAIQAHGLTCEACGFNFEKTYGDHGKGYIHVHHNKPISESGPIRPNPVTDMSVLCPNCHAMVHREKDHTLTLEELRTIIAEHH